MSSHSIQLQNLSYGSALYYQCKAYRRRKAAINTLTKLQAMRYTDKQIIGLLGGNGYKKLDEELLPDIMNQQLNGKHQNGGPSLNGHSNNGNMFNLQNLGNRVGNGNGSNGNQNSYIQRYCTYCHLK